MALLSGCKLVHLAGAVCRPLARISSTMVDTPLPNVYKAPNVALRAVAARWRAIPRGPWGDHALLEPIKLCIAKPGFCWEEAPPDI